MKAQNIFLKLPAYGFNLARGWILLAACGVAAWGQTRPASVEPASVTPRGAAQVTADYVGTERCESCHGAEVTVFQKTKHAAIPAHAGEVSGCETCHGPGRAHADGEQAARGDDDKIAAAAKLIVAFNGNPRESSEMCLSCHLSSRSQADFSRSAHIQHGVSCNSCHSMHLVETAREPRERKARDVQATLFLVPRLEEQNRWLAESQLKESQPGLCFGCHQNIQAQFALPTHHRVPEGAMKCTDCHNTHGSANQATLRQSGWEACATCHVEKRGPFLFEHSAVKVQGCVACHTPHGSVNRMLMTRREERFLCLQCHVNPDAVNVPHGRLGFQTRGDCSRCHTSVHGSNFDPAFLH